MRRPEYWEPDEIHEQYAEWLKTQPAQVGEPSTPLSAAIPKARGEVCTEGDVRAAINFGNKLYAALISPNGGQILGGVRLKDVESAVKESVS